MKQLISNLYLQAQHLGACDLFTGKERTFDDIARIFLTPQGQEFCIKHRWPSLTTFRAIRATVGAEEMASFGIYVDAGNIRMHNPEPRKVVLIGRTTATINCDGCERYQVTMMHGAKAVVNAAKWAVVATESDCRGNLIGNVSDNAIIL